jgi:recombination protein RecA
MGEMNKELKTAIALIESQIGKGAIMRLGEGTALDVQGVSSGALSLDIALGGKGLPRGRVTEIYGPESSGKTTIALQTIACAQRAGGVAAFIDAEHALDPSWCKRLGVDLESLLISQPDNAEDALRIAEMLVVSNAVDVIVIDSVAALVPRNEVEGEIGEAQIGLIARLMSQALRKLTPNISKTKTCMIFINQIRQKIGVMFGNPETTSGGLALKFFSSVRLDVRKIENVKDGDRMVGSRVRVKVVKNKIAPPFKQAEFDLMYENGINREGDLLDLACDEKARVVEKSGNWFSYNGTRMANGRANTIQYLRENPAITEEIGKRVLAAFGLTGNAAPSPSPSDNGKDHSDEAGDGEAAGKKERKRAAAAE